MGVTSNFGPERADFRPPAGFEVDSPPATTLENNEKIQPREQAENGL